MKKLLSLVLLAWLSSGSVWADDEYDDLIYTPSPSIETIESSLVSEQLLVDDILRAFVQSQWLSIDAAQRPVWVVKGTPAVAQRTLSAIRLALTHRGERQVVGNRWLKALMKTQSQSQVLLYQSRPRSRLQSPDVMLVVDRVAIKPGQSELRAVVVAVQALENKASESLNAGERVPLVAAVQRLNTHVGDGELLGNGLQVKGIGFCNTALSVNRYQYSAEEAAKLDARSRLLELLDKAQLSKTQTSFHGEISRDERAFHLSGTLKGFRVIESHYDSVSCKAMVTATLQGVTRPQDANTQWWKPVVSFISLATML